jgi:hypothetical protein
VTAPRDILPLLDTDRERPTFESLLSRLLAHDDEWTRLGRATKGIEPFRVVESSGTRVRLCGRIWETTKQKQ